MIAKRQWSAQALSLSGLGRLLPQVNTWHGVLGLGYHRIGRPQSSLFDRALWSATPEAFDEQVGLLKKHFDLIVASELPEVLQKGRGRYVLITFDDGYRDNYDCAFEILKSHGVRATFFVTTGFIDKPHLAWWDEISWMVRTSPKNSIHKDRWLETTVEFDEPDRQGAIDTLLRRYKSLDTDQTEDYLNKLAGATGSGRYDPALAREMWMTWDMLREMKHHGMCIGGHTVSHPVLKKCSMTRQESEIGGCVERIEQELGERPDGFSYPLGGLESFDQRTRKCLREQGVNAAFSYYGGYRRFEEWDAYDIRRARVEMTVGTADFRAVMALPQIFA